MVFPFFLWCFSVKEEWRHQKLQHLVNIHIYRLLKQSEFRYVRLYGQITCNISIFDWQISTSNTKHRTFHCMFSPQHLCSSFLPWIAKVLSVFPSLCLRIWINTPANSKLDMAAWWLRLCRQSNYNSVTAVPVVGHWFRFISWLFFTSSLVRIFVSPPPILLLLTKSRQSGYNKNIRTYLKETNFKKSLDELSRWISLDRRQIMLWRF